MKKQFQNEPEGILRLWVFEVGPEGCHNSSVGKTFLLKKPDDLSPTVKDHMCGHVCTVLGRL